jgi:hypothetical protein
METMQHQWKPMEEYISNEEDSVILVNGEYLEKINIIKKISPNQYIVLYKNGGVETYNSVIENLRKQGLDIGKGNCEYGWKMPLINKKRELRIFRRH